MLRERLDPLAQVDELAQQHQTIIDKQRRYFKAVRSFQEACDENERLSNLVEDEQ